MVSSTYLAIFSYNFHYETNFEANSGLVITIRASAWHSAEDSLMALGDEK